MVLLDNNVVNLSPSQQWAAVWGGSVIAVKRYDDNSAIDIKSYINQTNSDRITFGIRAEYQNDPVNNPWAGTSDCVFGFVGTVLQDEQISVTVKNNFPGGKIKGQVNNSNPPIINAPVTITDMTRKTLYMGAVEGTNQPMVGGYDHVFNDTEASLNKSNWYMQDQLGAPKGIFDSGANTYRILSSTEKNYSYVADMKKLCNVTFTTLGGTMTVGGTSSSSPITKQVVEQNTITATCSNFYANGVNFVFNYTWLKSSQTFTSPITIAAHETYEAVFQAKPSYSTINIKCNSPVGSPIVITWTDIPDQHVTQYEVRRKVKQNGVFGPLETLATLSAGVGTYTDYEYRRTSSYVDLVNYEVRAYYNSTDSKILSGYSDPYWLSVYGQMLAKMNKDQMTQEMAVELPTDYSISNFPNPFNPATTIKYQLPEAGVVTIKVYDILGKEVAELVNENKGAGYYNIVFDASELTSGIYIYTIQVNNFVESKKIMLVK